MYSRKKRWQGSLIFLLLMMVVVLAGCASNSSTPESNKVVNETPPSAQNPPSEPAPKEQASPLIVYGNDFMDEVSPLYKAATGYEIETVHFGGGALLAKVETEQANPQWDVIMMDGHGSIQGLADRDFFLTGWTPHQINNYVELGREFLPENRAYFPMGIHAAAVIAYNTNYVSADEAPQTWDAFFQYNGPIGHADPAVAAPAYPVVSSFFHKWGIDESKALYQQRFQAGFATFPKNPQVAAALVSGEIHAAALQETNAFGLKMKGEPIEVVWPEEGAPGSLRVIAINKQSKNLDAAKAFVEFMLNAETLSELTALEGTEGFFTPLIQGAASNPERPAHTPFLLPPASWAADKEAEIKTWFADQAVQ